MAICSCILPYIILFIFIMLFIAILLYSKPSLGFTIPTFTATKHMSYGFTYPEQVRRGSEQMFASVPTQKMSVPGRQPVSDRSEWAGGYDAPKPPPPPEKPKLGIANGLFNAHKCSYNVV